MGNPLAAGNHRNVFRVKPRWQDSRPAQHSPDRPRTASDALRPATLFAPVQEVFDDLLDFLDLDRLLGAAELDEHFQRIVVILEGVNPANVLPDFTALMDTIRARITDLDITPQIESFGQSLVNLKADLEEQLGRTENAYTDMYEAIPEGVK